MDARALAWLAADGPVSSDGGLSPRRGGLVRLALASAVVALLAFLLADVGVRPPMHHSARAAASRPAAGATASTPAGRAGLDVPRVMDTIRHRLVSAPGGVLVAEDDQYRATFGDDGFAVVPRGGSALRVSTGASGRAGATVKVHPGVWRASGNVARRSLARGVIEQVTATTGRVEWDVVLASRPAGHGDLRVDARVSGATGSPERRAAGWRWATRDGRGLVMGAVVVHDRSGAEVARARPQASASGVRLTVPAEVLDRAAYPLTIDPVVSVEHPVSTPVTSKAEGEHSEPAVASDGSGYLVVWADTRPYNATAHIFGARVNAAGTVLDATGFEISNATGTQIAPAVAFDGTNYLVVWSDSRSGVTPDIYGARVTPAGTVMDTAGLPISTAPDFQNDPAVAFDGHNYLVVWSDRRSGTATNLYGTRVSPAGTVLDGVAIGIAISNAAGEQSSPAVSFDGTDWLAVWQDSRAGTDVFDVYGARVNPAGTVLDASGILISAASGFQGLPAVASTGSGSLVVWTDQRSGPNSDTYGARVTSGGTVLDATGIAISAATSVQNWPSIASDGTTYLVADEDQRLGSPDIFATQVSATGTILKAGFALATGTTAQTEAAVGSNGAGYLVAWNDMQEIAASRLSSAAVVQSPSNFTVATSANPQAHPAVAFDGTNYLVVWEDYRVGVDLYAARVSPSGTMLDGSGFVISAAAGAQMSPAVAFDGTSYLVVWQDGRSGSNDIYGARVSTGGTVMDTTGIPISAAPSNQTDPAVTFAGGNYLVVWTDNRNGVNIFLPDVYGTGVSPAGHVINQSGFAIASGAGDQLRPAVAFDGSNSMVVWQDHHGGQVGFDISGVRVSQAGAVVGTSFPVSAAAQSQMDPAIAFDGTRYLVVWQDFRLDPNLSDIFGARVNTGGGLLDSGGIQISAAPDQQDAPAVTANGSFFVVWRDRRSGTNDDVYGTGVDGAAGTVSAPSGVLIAGSSTDEREPAITSRSANNFGVVYRRYSPEPQYRSSRVYLRTIAPK